jgi:hypothetical protein
MSESKQGFTVKDRRQFNAEGERKASEEAAQTAAPSAAPQPAPNAPDAATAASVPGHDEWRHRGDVDFASFLVSLAAQAGALMAPEGEGRDLDGARQIIGILEMLRGKTEGRRTPDEDRLVEGLLYQLRMAYLEVSKEAGA